MAYLFELLPRKMNEHAQMGRHHERSKLVGRIIEGVEKSIEIIQTLEQIDGSALHEGGIKFRQATQMIDGATNNKDGVGRIALRRH